jgi:hypothetical protein
MVMLGYGRLTRGAKIGRATQRTFLASSREWAPPEAYPFAFFLPNHNTSTAVGDNASAVGASCACSAPARTEA